MKVPAFVTKFFVWLLRIIVGLVVEMFVSKANKLIEEWNAKDKIRQDALKSVQALRDAKTKDEIDKASDSTIDDV